jgi:hypothetical protein
MLIFELGSEAEMSRASGTALRLLPARVVLDIDCVMLYLFFGLVIDND